MLIYTFIYNFAKEWVKLKGMKSLDECIILLRTYMKDQQYGIEQIGIFGSLARGEQREDSDIDVCVTMTHPNLFALSGIRQDLEQLFGCSVDIVRKHKHMNPNFLRNIERDCVYA